MSEFFDLAEGGSTLNGSAIVSTSITASGGSLSGGNAVVSTEITASGGSLSGGNAVVSTEITASGGSLSGGNAVVSIAAISLGGATSGGQADAWLVDSISGQGGSSLSGSANTSISISGSGGANVDGDANISGVNNLSGTGGILANGTAVVRMKFKYISTGGSTSTGGAAVYYFSPNIDLEIAYETRALLEFSKQFKWQTGLLPLRWFRVQGCCKFPTSQGDGVGENIPGGCSVMGMQTDDSKCVGASGKQQYIQNLVGRSVADICQQLSDSKLDWEICSIKEWSRPADGRLVAEDDNCNVLSEVPFADIPECLKFAIHTDAITYIKASSVPIDVVYHYEGSGLITTGGTADTQIVGQSNPDTSIFEFISLGGNTTTGGEAYTTYSYDNNALTNIKASTSIVSFEAIFGSGQTGNSIVLPSQIVGTTCGSCTAMPATIYLFHNIANNNVLTQYLYRNGLEMPNPLVMHYNVRLQSWVANFHMTGTSDDNDGTTENWRFSFEWSCVNSFAGNELGASSWKFGIMASRINMNTGVYFDTRNVIVFPPGAICSAIQNLNFDFTFNLNTKTNFVSNDIDVVPNTILLTDYIGLFKSKYWINNPNLSIRLSKKNISIEAQKQDISSIIPKSVSEGARTPFITR